MSLPKMYFEVGLVRVRLVDSRELLALTLQLSNTNTFPVLAIGSKKVASTLISRSRNFCVLIMGHT